MFSLVDETRHYPTTEVTAEIASRLDAVEREHDVEIIHAIESGSRGWGFASDDSDYDVRFLYVHRPHWYLRVDPGRDVIEYPIVDEIDLGGWELNKALKLLRRSNGALLEWLGSPVVYRQHRELWSRLFEIGSSQFQAVSAFHHYRAMAHRKLNLEQPTLKDLCYGLRTLLAAQWVLEKRTPPPMRFAELVEALVPEPGEVAMLKRMIEQKGRVDEKSGGEIPAELVDWTAARRTRVDEAQPESGDKPETALFDALMRNAVESIWQVDLTGQAR